MVSCRYCVLAKPQAARLAHMQTVPFKKINKHRDSVEAAKRHIKIPRDSLEGANEMFVFCPSGQHLPKGPRFLGGVWRMFDVKCLILDVGNLETRAEIARRPEQAARSSGASNSIGGTRVTRSGLQTMSNSSGQGPEILVSFQHDFVIVTGVRRLEESGFKLNTHSIREGTAGQIIRSETTAAERCPLSQDDIWVSRNLVIKPFRWSTMRSMVLQKCVACARFSKQCSVERPVGLCSLTCRHFPCFRKCN